MISGWWSDKVFCCLTGWQTQCLTDSWLVGFLSDKCVDCLISSLVAWLTEWLAICLTGWLTGLLKRWHTECFDYSGDWFVQQVTALPMDGLACCQQPPFHTFLITERKPRCLLKGFCVLRQPLFTRKLPTMLHKSVYWLCRSSLESSNKGLVNWHPISLNAASQHGQPNW